MVKTLPATELDVAILGSQSTSLEQWKNGPLVGWDILGMKYYPFI